MRRKKDLHPLVMYLNAVLLMGLCSAPSFAQATYSTSSDWQGSQEKGLTAMEQIRGSSTQLGQITTFDTSIGYNFNNFLGVDVGLPIYFVRTPSFFSNNRDRNRGWMDGLGDPYVNVRFNGTAREVNFLSVLTGTAPTASFRKGLTTGRVGVDWFNHIDGSSHGFTPFVNFGLANGIVDRHILPRPYSQDRPFRTLGFVSDFEGGMSYKLWRKLTVGASMYVVIPTGQQKVFSEYFRQGALPSTGDSDHSRVWETAFETVGPSSIARDNGYSGWFGFSPSRIVDVQVGYSRSVRYALDTVTFTIALNANSLARKLTNY